MHPIIELGPLNLGSGALLLVIAIFVGHARFERVARQRGGEALEQRAGRCAPFALAGAAIGARLWYGLFNWDMYSQSPGLFLALRLGDLAWPGALIGGALAGYAYLRLRHIDDATAPLADAAVLALPLAQAIASLGLLLNGDALGAPTDLPWAVPLFGTLRHPVALYYLLAALATWGVLTWVARRSPQPGTLAMTYLAVQGSALLLLEALRVDSLVTAGGVRIAQVVGLAMILMALWWKRTHATSTP
ncbi:prolipoprotein diacylglyceryl transferase [Roseiflexus sp.]|uniref:prolipoprotein diacylglyceryl transferase n=1 Tax=Roseiflexus sp. TaxID=2562120 RepID=UPI0021DDC3B0|nr:prolipoprotein diacylglyceryl transferase family protein [Roseiflexus sp.]GIV99783.1 MAG: prolipoprotein diacylglyceryl transferase [Roseiflexus sp.]